MNHKHDFMLKYYKYVIVCLSAGTLGSSYTENSQGE